MTPLEFVINRVGASVIICLGCYQFYLRRNVDRLERQGKVTPEAAIRIRKKPMAIYRMDLDTGWNNLPRLAAISFNFKLDASHQPQSADLMTDAFDRGRDSVETAMIIARKIASVAVALGATVCLASDPQPIRDRSSFEKAIIVNVSPVREVDWIMQQIRKLHPDANLGDLEQGLVEQNGRRYDMYALHTDKGKKIVMYFDIGKVEAPSPTATIPD